MSFKKSQQINSLILGVLPSCPPTSLSIVDDTKNDNENDDHFRTDADDDEDSEIVIICYFCHFLLALITIVYDILCLIAPEKCQ